MQKGTRCFRWPVCPFAFPARAPPDCPDLLIDLATDELSPLSRDGYLWPSAYLQAVMKSKVQEAPGTHPGEQWRRGAMLAKKDGTVDDRFRNCFSCPRWYGLATRSRLCNEQRIHTFFLAIDTDAIPIQCVDGIPTGIIWMIEIQPHALIPNRSRTDDRPNGPLYPILPKIE